jgi:hypothetical protein
VGQKKEERGTAHARSRWKEEGNGDVSIVGFTRLWRLAAFFFGFRFPIFFQNLNFFRVFFPFPFQRGDDSSASGAVPGAAGYNAMVSTEQLQTQSLQSQPQHVMPPPPPPPPPPEQEDQLHIPAIPAVLPAIAIAPNPVFVTHPFVVYFYVSGRWCQENGIRDEEVSERTHAHK